MTFGHRLRVVGLPNSARELLLNTASILMDCSHGGGHAMGFTL